MKMRIDDLPVLIVSAVRPEPPQLVGSVSRWQWVGEGHIAYLYLGGTKFIEGKFRNVNEISRSVCFAFKHPDRVPEIQPGESIRYFDGYWGERALLVFDDSLGWHERVFEPRDAVKTFHDGHTEEIPGGWDHDHCSICWATISQRENTTFVKSIHNDSVCMECYRLYVLAKSIDFIQEA